MPGAHNKVKRPGPSKNPHHVMRVGNRVIKNAGPLIQQQPKRVAQIIAERITSRQQSRLMSGVRYAKRTGHAAYIGKGENVWGNMSVHVQDLSDLYLFLLSHSLSNPLSTTASPASHGWSNLIYAGLNTHSWGPIISLIGDLLYARGDVKVPGAKSVEEGDLYMFGTNSFMEVSEKAKALGWRQKQPGLEESVRQALPGPASKPVKKD